MGDVIYPCDYYVSQAKTLGISDEQIESFRKSNTNPDSTWDCHRLLSAFGGSREVEHGSVSAAQVVAAQSLPPPIIQTTAGGVGATTSLPRSSSGSFVILAIAAAIGLAAWWFLKGK